MKRVSRKKTLASLVKETLRYRKKKQGVVSLAQKEIEAGARDLYNNLKNKAPKEKLAECLGRFEGAVERLLPRSFFEKCVDFFGAVIIALVLAVCIRQEWFELYHVPTGSMRDTVLEQDNFFVSKDAFGLNIPLAPGHIYFDSKLLKRMSVVLFSGEGLPISNNITRYFWIFPGVKQYVKRLVAKGGDRVYFYGGRLYSIDENGKDLKQLREGPWTDGKCYVPYYDAAGHMSTFGYDSGAFIFSQMHMPLLKVRILGQSTIDAEFFDGSKWRAPSLDSNPNFPTQYRQLWGLGNYAQLRMVKEDGKYFLKLYTLPKLTQSAWKIERSGFRTYPVLKLNTSFIPLNQQHIERLFNSLYTARFVVKQGRAMLYDYRRLRSSFSPKIPGVSDGTYEFYHGKLYEIGFLGQRKELKSPHPLLHKNPDLLMLLFNLGMHFNTEFMKPGGAEIPQRFAFYRDGALLVMNQEIYSAKDPTLERFVAEQKERANREGCASSFVPFIDPGAPVDREGNIDGHFISQFGLRVPSGHIMALGDNYAQSGDSRVFGFVPVENVRGKAIYTFWPRSSTKMLKQPNAPFVTLSRVIVWILVLIILLCTKIYRSSRKKRALSWIESNFT
jgi:signal peptidase I